MPSPILLIVDDNASNLKLLRLLLTGEGYQVRSAASGAEALAVLAEIRPDLILTDIQMPGMNGLELVRQIKAESATAAVPVVAVTAYAMSGDEASALAAGCDAYVAKPIDTRELPKLLARLLKREDIH